MSWKIQYSDDQGRGLAEVQGSDGRLNVSSRSDARSYYNSRDAHLTFAVPFAVTLMDTDEDFVAWRNASDDKELVISHAMISVFEPVDIKWHVGTGIPAAGTVIVPVNLNQGSGRSAPTDGSVSVMMGTTTTPLTGLTSSGVVAHHGILAIQESVVSEFHDEIRLGQNDTFFGELEDASVPGYVRGTLYGYYE
jgi:hypothetical protein